MKIFLIDVARCNGCRNCQISCKDEHCGTSWLPYAEEQPLTGQFWCEVEEQTRGTVPKVRMNYIPHIDGQNNRLAEEGGDAVIKREDGLVYIDPEKAKGRKDLAEIPGVYWNEELQIPQSCTGCAHLLDDGWSVPRCVDACPTEAMNFGEKSDFDLSDAEPLPGIDSLDARVWYRNLPKRFITGCLVDFDEHEVVIGRKVRLLDADGTEVASMLTDDFGDFQFDQIEPLIYSIEFQTKGDSKKVIEADVSVTDINLGDISVV